MGSHRKGQKRLPNNVWVALRSSGGLWVEASLASHHLWGWPRPLGGSAQPSTVLAPGGGVKVHTASAASQVSEFGWVEYFQKDGRTWVQLLPICVCELGEKLACLEPHCLREGLDAGQSCPCTRHGLRAEARRVATEGQGFPGSRERRVLTCYLGKLLCAVECPLQALCSGRHSPPVHRTASPHPAVTGLWDPLCLLQWIHSCVSCRGWT